VRLCGGDGSFKPVFKFQRRPFGSFNSPMINTLSLVSETVAIIWDLLISRRAQVLYQTSIRDFPPPTPWPPLSTILCRPVPFVAGFYLSTFYFCITLPLLFLRGVHAIFVRMHNLHSTPCFFPSPPNLSCVPAFLERYAPWPRHGVINIRW